MTVRRLSEAAGLAAAALPDGDRPVTGGYVGDLLSRVMGRASAGDAWITIMSNPNTVAVAVLADVACVILAEGVLPDDGVAALAGERGVNLLLSPASAYETALRLQRCLSPTEP